MLNGATATIAARIDKSRTEFLSCDFNQLLETALLRDSFKQLSQFLRV
jgi:hypothetical protein